MPPRGVLPAGKVLKMNTLAPRPFREPVGLKPVYLPNFVLTLLRTPKLPSNMATFIVPLNMNKLDIKDYLWNAYGIPVLGVRSYVEQQRVQKARPGPGGSIRLSWYRPRAIKKMTVEMGSREQGRDGKGGGPFVWPNELEKEEMEPWDRESFMAADKANEQMSQERGLMAARHEKKGRGELAEQARRLREGREEWRPTWQELKGEKE